MFTPRFLVISRTRFPPGLKFAGEIDRSNATLVTEILSSENGNEDLHVDVSRLNFCDTSGITALVDAANDSAIARRIVVHGLPQQLERAIRMVGWGERLGLRHGNHWAHD